MTTAFKRTRENFYGFGQTECEIWSSCDTLKDGRFAQKLDLGSVYMGPDPLGTGTKLVRINLVFTRDLVDPVRIGSAMWYHMGALMKVIPYGTVPFQF